MGKALALCVGDARAEWIAACSAEARRLGVVIGMKCPDAQGLAGPGRLVMLPHAPRADRRALERLAAECERFSPCVALEDAEEPTAILADTTGLAPLWDSRNGDERLAEAVQCWAAEKRLVAVVAVAPTPGLALAAARYGPRRRQPLVVLPHDALEVARSMPVDALRIEPTVLEGLYAIGVQRVGQLLALPRSGLPSRFGAGLVRRLDQFLGEAAEPLESFRGEAPLSATWEFEPPVANAQALEHARQRLFERLTKRMARRHFGALRVLVEHALDVSPAEPVRVALRLFRPTASARELAELATLHLEGVRFAAAVRSIRVLVGATAPIDAHQRTLFDDHRQADPHALALLINRLASRLGVDRVLRVQKQASIDPLRAYATRPATDVAPERFSLTALQAGRAHRLPLRMRSKPAPIVVETDEHGEPLAVILCGRRMVARAWGPERVETGWWRGRGLRRDAWWVELEDGARLWLQCGLVRREWRWAGEF